MSESEKYGRLIERIARDVVVAEDAMAAAEALAAIDAKGWKRHIAKARQTFRARERRRVNDALHRAQKKELPATLTLDEWLHTLEFFKGRCAYCQMAFSYEQLEHVIPLASLRAGTTVQNCVPVCRKCNAQKHAHPLGYWYRKRRQLQLPFAKTPPDDLALRIVEVHQLLYRNGQQQTLEFQKTDGTVTTQMPRIARVTVIDFANFLLAQSNDYWNISGRKLQSLRHRNVRVDALLCELQLECSDSQFVYVFDPYADYYAAAGKTTWNDIPTISLDGLASYVIYSHSAEFLYFSTRAVTRQIGGPLTLVARREEEGLW